MTTAHWWLLAILGVTLTVYGPVGGAAFVYEDHQELGIRAAWRGWSAELHPYVWPDRSTGGTWLAPRMLTNLTYRIQAGMGDGPRGYHLGNVAVHVLNGFLLWQVLIGAGLVAAGVGTGLYLLHPMQVEAVAYVSSRPDLLAGTAILLMLLATRVPGWSGIWLVTLAGGLAVLAKESAIVVVGLLPLWLLVWHRGGSKWHWLVPLTAWSVMGIVAAWRLLPMMSVYTPRQEASWFAYVATQSAALWRMIALILVPVGLTVDHDFDLVTLPVAAAALLALSLATVCAWRERARWPLCAGAIGWVLIAVAPRFVIRLPDYINEHQMLVPLLGVWMALGLCAQQLVLSRQGESVYGREMGQSR